jgi:hypothetical protein
MMVRLNLDKQDGRVPETGCRATEGDRDVL